MTYATRLHTERDRSLPKNTAIVLKHWPHIHITHWTLPMCGA